MEGVYVRNSVSRIFCYRKCFRQGTCWYLQIVISEQTFFESNHQLDLRIDNQKIDETSTTKFLGVYIDNKLNWKTNTSYIGGKLQEELEF